MKFLSRKNKIERKAGFTLVETLVAVSIFSISIAAMISVVASGVGNTITVKNRIVGNNLAQENIEYLRHLRNRYAGPGTTTDWNNFVANLSQCNNDQNSGQICAMPDIAEESPNPEFRVCLDHDECSDLPIYYDSNGYYFQPGPGAPSGATLTAFRRYFDFYVDLAKPDEAKITVTVVWRERNNTERSVSLSETLTNWIPQ